MKEPKRTHRMIYSVDSNLELSIHSFFSRAYHWSIVKSWKSVTMARYRLLRGSEFELQVISGVPVGSQWGSRGGPVGVPVGSQRLSGVKRPTGLDIF